MTWETWLFIYLVFGASYTLTGLVRVWWDGDLHLRSVKNIAIAAVILALAWPLGIVWKLWDEWG